MANPIKELDLKPSGFQLIREVPINAPPKKVWESVLNLNGWFGMQPGHRHTLEPIIGGQWHTELPGGAQVLQAVVTYIEPMKLLRLSGALGLSHLPANSVWIFELQEQEDGKSTLLRLAQRTFGYLDSEAESRFTNGWSQILPRLKELAESAGH
jgi:uncharacterized protein YndB with AHSA1/START domain